MMDDILAREKYQNFEGKETLCLACNRTFNLLVSHCPIDSTQLIRIGQDENAENSSTTPKSAGSITLETGCIFDGRYEILAKAGEGGMGTVYAARNVDTGAQVAIKLLNAELLGDNDDQARFRREGNILAELKHPNIVKFYEYGVFQNVLPYLVLEWLEAKSLRTLINNGPILPNKVIEIGLQVCDALQCVHNAGIVHRDLKPNNILIADSDGSAKLLDFGLSRILNESPLVLTRHLTRTGLLIGSVHYMSPEQCIGKKVDARKCATLVIFTGLLFFVAIAIQQKEHSLAHKTRHQAQQASQEPAPASHQHEKHTSERTAANTEEGEPARVTTPEFLLKVLPSSVASLAVQDVFESDGHYKLVSWANDFTDNNLALVEVTKGETNSNSTRIIWHIEEEGQYCPEFGFVPDSEHRGHYIYLLFRQKGAAYQTVLPLSIANDRVNLLPGLEEEIFKIYTFPNHSTRLVGYHREFQPITGEKPTVYRWTGKEFVADYENTRQMYDYLAQQNHNKPDTLESFDPDLVELVDAQELAAEGFKRQALTVLNRISPALCEGTSVDAMQLCADLFDRLGQKEVALATAMRAREAVLNRHKREVNLDAAGGDPSPVVNCAQLLAQHGKNTEALSLLNDIRQEMKGVYNAETKKSYANLVSKLSSRSAQKRQ